jgi:SAM-dependent methyltransferase
MKSMHKYNNPLIVAKSVYRETLIRSLFNEAIKGYEISGSVLDIGSKSIKSGYYKKIKIKEGTNITFTDLHEGEGVVKLDVEKDFPFEDSTFDCVISFHLFEHVFNYQNSVEEIQRILKPGGKFIIAVPFMHKFHADPDDFYRFTSSAIKRIWSSSGLQCESMEYVGEGFFSYALTTMASFIKPNFLKGIIKVTLYLLGTILDRIVNIKHKTIKRLYALEHIAVFKKR